MQNFNLNIKKFGVIKNINLNLKIFFITLLFFFFINILRGEEQNNNVKGEDAFILGLNSVSINEYSNALKYFNNAQIEGKFVNEAKYEALKILSNDKKQDPKNISTLLNSIEDKKVMAMATVAVARNYYKNQKIDEGLELLVGFQNKFKMSQIELLNEVFLLMAQIYFYEKNSFELALEQLYSITKSGLAKKEIMVGAYSLLSKIYLSKGNNILGCAFLQKQNELINNKELENNINCN